MFFFFRSIPSINLKKSRCSTFVKKCPRLQKVSCKKWQGVWQACRRRHVAISRPHISTNKHARVYRFYKNSSSASTTMHVLAMWNAQGCVCVCLRVLQCVFRFLFESVENPLEVILCLFVWEWFCVCWRVLCNTWECFSRVLRENSRVLVRLQLSVSQKIESEVESFSVFCERELESASESARVYTHCTTLPHTVTHCNTLQHTATHCNTLQHTATHCNTLQSSRVLVRVLVLTPVSIQRLQVANEASMSSLSSGQSSKNKLPDAKLQVCTQVRHRWVCT